MNAARPFAHAEHVGSLLRPRALRDAFKAHQEGALDSDGLSAAEDSAVREVIAMQERVGLAVVTDGEVRRPSYWAPWAHELSGMEIGEAIFRFHDDQGHENAFTAPSVMGRLSRPEPISVHEYEFAADVTDRTVKITMPSPSTLLFWRGTDVLPGDEYPSAASFFEHLCSIYRDEIADLAARGCRYVQLDEVPLIMLADPAIRDVVRARDEDPDELISIFIDAITAAVRDRPADMVAGMHICRGNYKGRWLAEGGYDAIAERLFSDADVDTFFLEYDSSRAGGLEPLRYLPAHKRVVLGLFSSKTADLEDLDVIRRRIDEAATYVDIERIGISPQCGFASTVGGNPITFESQEAKLSRIVEVAAEVWGSTNAQDLHDR
jgi:5-methyltetrahydropteroyltriglutamate--homocysteine methyltransferase